MCGIFFLINSTLQIQDISKQYKAQAHRGPDHSSLIVYKNKKLLNTYHIGHHKLSIVDTENQPFNCEEDILVSDAEIYNGRTIQEYLRAYMSKGDIKIMERLEGDYAFVYFHKKTKKIVIGRDYVGLKPLYISYDQSKLLLGFASEAKALVGIIEPVPPGSIFTFYYDSFSGYKIESRYSILKHKSPENIHCKIIRDLMIESVKKRVEHTDVPLALLCSGGINSSIITTLVSKLYPHRNFKAYTIQYTGPGIAQDCFYAESLISTLPNIELETFSYDFEMGLSIMPEVVRMFEISDVPIIRAGIPMYLLAKHISQTSVYKVLLGGEGADELFMGLSYFATNDPTAEQASTESRRLVDHLHDSDLLRAERTFASHGLEIRLPFLDRDVVNYVLDVIPGSLRLPQKKVEKYLLRKSFVDYIVNDKILYRPKEEIASGVGTGWVPDLIRHFNNEEENAYKQHLHINIKRVPNTLPKWAVTIPSFALRP
jgi:asparagine synthase (glutamine-hydrolysing)